MGDKEIIELIRKGQHTRAFEKIYDSFPMIKKMIVSSGGGPDDAKDIFQDSLIVFYRLALKPDFNLTSSISTFIYSVCRKLWLKKLRNDVSRKFTIKEDEVIAEDPENLDEALEESARSGLAEKVVNALGEPCKSILHLFYFEKSSMKEIAEQMGYSNEKTAKAQKYKCIERGKKMLEEKLQKFKMI